MSAQSAELNQETAASLPGTSGSGGLWNGHQALGNGHQQGGSPDDLSNEHSPEESGHGIGHSNAAEAESFREPATAYGSGQVRDLKS